MFLTPILKKVENHKKLFLFLFFSIVLLLIVAILASPFILAFAPSKIKDYAYKELTYRQIAYNLTNDIEDKEDMLRALFNYVKFNESVESSYTVMDETPLNDLVRGIAWCDQEAFLLGTLLDECGINSRLRDVQHHTVLEVYLKGEWRLVDPFFGELFYRTKDDEIATLKDVITGYGKTVYNKRFKELMVSNNFDVIPSDLYKPSEVRWSNGIGPDYKKFVNKSKTRLVIDKVVELGYYLYGKNYSYWFQDHYLNSFKATDPGPVSVNGYLSQYKVNDKAYQLYFKARNYHLFGRYNKALDDYDAVINNDKLSFWSKESEYYKGIAYFDKKNYLKSEEVFSNLSTNINQSKYNRAFLINTLVEARNFYNLNRLDMMATGGENFTANNFSEGLSRILLGSKWGFIDIKGNMVIEPQFDYAYNFSEGLARVMVGNKWGFIDKSGKFIINPQYDVVNDFSESLSMVIKSDTNSAGYIDKTGKEVIPSDYLKTKEFKEGLAAVVKNNKWGFIDKSGKLIISMQYNNVNNFSEGLASVDIGDKWGFIDKIGKLAIEPRFKAVDSFNEGLAGVNVNGKWGFVDKTGKLVIEPRYDSVNNFSADLASVEVGGKWGFVNKIGKIVIEPAYDNVTEYSEDAVGVEVNGKWGFMDKSGKIIIEPQFDRVNNFSNGLAYVEKNSKWMYIDKAGKAIIDMAK